LEAVLAPHNETHLVPVIIEDQDKDGDSRISFDEFRGQKCVHSSLIPSARTPQ
jgi:hypothetical protein